MACKSRLRPIAPKVENKEYLMTLQTPSITTPRFILKPLAPRVENKEGLVTLQRTPVMSSRSIIKPLAPSVDGKEECTTMQRQPIMACRNILKPLARRIESKEEHMSQFGCQGKKEVLRTFSYESFLTAKNCKKVTYEDFLTAVLEFGAHTVEATGEDLRGYLTHLSFMCKMAATKKYDQQVHIAYDRAIRLRAEDVGWPAFKANITSIANLYYDKENKEEHHELDQVESDSEHCGLEDSVMSDEDQSNGHSRGSTSETLELQYEKDHNYATDEKQEEMELPGTNTISQSTAVSTDTNIVKQSTDSQEGTQYIPSGGSSAPPSSVSNDSKLQTVSQPQKKHTCSQCGKQFTQIAKLKNHVRIHTLEPKQLTPIDKGLEIPIVEQLTQKDPSMRQKGKRRAFSKQRSRRGSTQAVSVGDPTDKSVIPSGESSAHTSVASKSSKLQKVQQPQKSHTCPQCGREFPRPSKLKNHMRIHTVEPGETVLQADESRNTHLHKSQEMTHICSHCSLKLSSAKALKAHLLRHTEGPPAKMHLCPQCGKRFRTIPDFQVHMRNHTGERPYSCIKCDKKFISKHSVNKHMLAHTEEKQNICSYCGMRFLHFSQLTPHLRIHTGEKPFVCSYCGQAFRMSGYLRIHTRIHTGEKPYTCPDCGKTFKCNVGLRMHKLTHTGEKPHKCPYCNRACRTSRHLKEHITTWHAHKHSRSTATAPDSKRKPHTCSECGKEFDYLASLKVHMISHTGGTPLTCTECGERCTSEARLTFHMMTHTQEKPFECSDCGKVFLRPGNLRIHQKTHAPERPNVCSYCNESFTHKADLDMHIKIHTGDKPYLCRECGKRFSIAAYLRKHIKFSHTETATASEKQSVVSTNDLLADSETPGSLPGIVHVTSS